LILAKLTGYLPGHLSKWDRRRIPETSRAGEQQRPAGQYWQRTHADGQAGAIDIRAGDKIVLMHLAANQDPRRFPDPRTFDADRPRNAEHIAFGRGPHTCIGAPLARLETKISIERWLRRLGPITLSVKHHESASQRKFQHDPSYVLRAISELHLAFKPGQKFA
jgi:cytochrome P450